MIISNSSASDGPPPRVFANAYDEWRELVLDLPKDEAEKLWKQAWAEVDFSWNGLADAGWELGESASDAQKIKRWRAPADFPGAGKLHGHGTGTWRESTLQEYWRCSFGTSESNASRFRLLTDVELREIGLLVEDDAGIAWHLLHRPKVWPPNSRGRHVSSNTIEIEPAETLTLSGTKALSEALTARLVYSAYKDHRPDPDAALHVAGARISDFNSALIKFREFAAAEGRRPVQLNAPLAAFGAFDASDLDFSLTRFRDVLFYGETLFDNAKFYGDAEFNTAQFFAHVSFSGAVFHDDAHFLGGSNFHGPAIFKNVRFNGVAVFGSVQFHAYGDFNHVNFNNVAGFDGTIFYNSGSFVGAQFSVDARFSFVRIFGEARFALTKFHGSANFINAKFQGPTSFNRALFSQLCQFSLARFAAGVSFREARFEQPVTFDRSDFSAGIAIEGAGRVDFRAATFVENALFSDAIFPSEADRYHGAFEGARFHKLADFKILKLSAFSAFAGADFERELLLANSGWDTKSAFNRAVLEAKRAAHRDLKWHLSNERWQHGWVSEHERGLDARFAGLEVGLRTLRRTMRTNNEQQREHEFYRYELQAACNRPSTPIWVKSFSFVYGIVSDYGNSIVRPIVALNALAILFAVVFWLWGKEVSIPPITGGGFLEALELSLQNIFRPFDVWSPRFLSDNEHLTAMQIKLAGTVNWIALRVAASIQSLLALALAFLVALALRRRFRMGGS